MKKSLITLLIIWLFVPTILLGQTTTHISGIIRNSSGNSVADVNVYISRVEQKYSVFASCLSGTDGSYTVSFKAPVDSICINVSGLNITPTSVICENKSQHRDIIVDEKAQEIDEVVVRAPKIYSKGDTISYYVASFQSKNDISIGQVLKRLPGITVSDAGQISYKGQPIKNFYIEGLDLMKGRYGVATNNIDPNSISTIEVLESHQDIKALKDLKPEERASINLKLKSGVKGVFNLIATLGGGYDDKLLWDNELIATYFQRNSQLLATYKGNNSGSDLEIELRSFDEFIRNWILLHIGTRINISLISDYIIKLTKLPIRFFDTKMLGDVIQRIGDHTRIKDFITETGLSLVFSIFNVIILGTIVLIYDWRVFLIFIGGTILYLTWVLMFMKRRAILDKKVFAQSASNQSNVIQLVMGMQEIKLCGCEEKKRWEWERIQAQIYQLISDGLTLSQYQQSGAILILQIKNALITALIASLTIQGEMTLGMMMAIQFIIGQLNNPVEQLISFVRKYQDAKLSLERLNDIYAINDEIIEKTSLIKSIPYETIRISNLCFKYDKLATYYTLDDITFDIPKGKTTAIVGLSGSGKTTLLKMILGFYKPDEGTIKIGNQDVLNYDLREWRMRCGVVMQDGFIFSDTIAGNIAPGVEMPDKFKLDNAAKIANILDFIHSLPMGYQTMIGTDGLGLSVGQKQRILIARAVYKNPDYILMDEATNALDAENESEIICNMNNFLRGRTAVIIAHRLSTIRNADNIIVLGNGSVVEQGTHEELVSRNGIYHTLVKNQLNI